MAFLMDEHQTSKSMVEVWHMGCIYIGIDIDRYRYRD
jgi:hypothetical protein